MPRNYSEINSTRYLYIVYQHVLTWILHKLIPRIRYDITIVITNIKTKQIKKQ